MSDSAGMAQNRDLMRKIVEAMVRIAIVVALAYWCFLIFLPFLLPLVWGAVIAVALCPLFTKLCAAMGGRRKTAGALFILIAFGALAIPAYFLAESFIEGVGWIRGQMGEGGIDIPPPSDNVAEWPVIGERVHAIWLQASNDLEKTLAEFSPQIRAFGGWLISTLTGFGVAFLMTIFSVLVAGLFLINADASARGMRALGARLGGEQGMAAMKLATQTIRSVAAGVLGVAAVQSIMAAIGLFIADVPAAGLWAGLVLVIAVMQLPPLIIMGPAIIYVIANNDSTTIKALFTIWALITSFSDTLLKPLFLGRGMDIPMPVILIGAIGGMLQSGILGLFLGAVVLAIGYMMFMAWMREPGSFDVDTTAPTSG